MSEKAGFSGLGAVGGLGVGIGVIAIAIAGLYASGLLAPQPTAPIENAAPTETAPQSATTPAPTATTPSATTPAPTATTPEPAAAAPERMEETEDALSEGAEASGDDATAQVAEQTPLASPSFDVVRVAPDGSTVIAGRGAPGSTLTVLVDGVAVDTQTIDTSGNFVSLLSLGASSAARVLGLSAALDDRQALSEDEIILAPTAAPQVATAEPSRAVPAPAAEQSAAPTQNTARETARNIIALVEPDDPDPVARVPEPATEPAPAGTDANATVGAGEETGGAAPRIDNTSAPQIAPNPAAPTAAAPARAPVAPAAIAVLRANREGVELVQPAQPDPGRAPEQIALDTIGYSPEGDVLLSGRSVPQTGIRVYLDNVARADLQAQADGRWRARLEGIEPGVYTLRLDALKADGSVLSRLETPFKRENPVALMASTPDSALNAAEQPVRKVTVQTGDTLWAISRERYGDGMLFVRVFEANRDSIRDPDLIYPGQIFTIPD